MGEKGLNFEGKEGTNVETAIDEENGKFYIRVDLNAAAIQSKAGNDMAAKGFMNFTHGERNIFGNLNLNIKKSAAQKKAELDERNRYVAKIEAENEALRAAAV